MIQDRNSKETNSFQNYMEDNVSKENNNLFSGQKNTNSVNNDKIDNEITSNTKTSISSNRDVYNNFVSKIKLNYHLNNPQGRTQTIILHTSLDRSINSIDNNSILENEKNNEIQNNNNINNPNLNSDTNSKSNFTMNIHDQLNNGFLLDNSSQYSNNVNNLQYNDNVKGEKDEKRNAINHINKIYEDKMKIKDGDNLDIDNNNKSSAQVKKDNFTINFNNNMFFMNDNKNKKISQNNYQGFPVSNIFNNFKPTSEESFKDKVFSSQNEFEENYPGLKKEENNNNILLPFGYQNNPFCNPNQNNNNNHKQNDMHDNEYHSLYVNDKNNNNLSPDQIKLGPTKSNYNNVKSDINELSTISGTNNYNYEQDKNNNKGISSFNLGNNNPSVNSLNFGQSLLDLNNNKIKDKTHLNEDEYKKKLIFNPINDDINNNNNNSPIYPDHQDDHSQQIPINYINEHNNPNYKDNINNNNYDNQPNNINDDDNSFNSLKNTYDIKDYSKLKNDLNQNGKNPNREYIKYNDDNLENQNINNRPYLFSPDNNNIFYNNNNMNHINKDLNSNNIYIKDNNNKTNNNNNNQEIILTGYEMKSLRTSLDYNDNSIFAEIDEKWRDKKCVILKSLLYGLLLGSTATCLFWLRNEETRKNFYEKYNRINIESVIHLFKTVLHPFEFLKKLLSEEKREVYSKVLSIAFVKFFDFLEKHGDGFRLIGNFLFFYGIWLVFKSLLRASIKLWKQYN